MGDNYLPSLTILVARDAKNLMLDHSDAHSFYILERGPYQETKEADGHNFQSYDFRSMESAPYHIKNKKSKGLVCYSDHLYLP